jgi:hypothetical protein
MGRDGRGRKEKERKKKGCDLEQVPFLLQAKDGGAGGFHDLEEGPGGRGGEEARKALLLGGGGGGGDGGGGSEDKVPQLLGVPVKIGLFHRRVDHVVHEGSAHGTTAGATETRSNYCTSPQRRRQLETAEALQRRRGRHRRAIIIIIIIIPSHEKTVFPVPPPSPLPLPFPFPFPLLLPPTIVVVVVAVLLLLLLPVSRRESFRILPLRRRVRTASAARDRAYRVHKVRVAFSNDGSQQCLRRLKYLVQLHHLLPALAAVGATGARWYCLLRLQTKLKGEDEG